MHAVELLNSDILDLPKARTDLDFERYVAAMLDAYLGELSKVRPLDFISQNIRLKHGLVEEVIGDIKLAINQYLRGYPYRAYELLARLINKLGAHFNQFFPPKDVAKELSSLYRMCTNKAASVGRDRLFHCPFELRHRVGTQRYSIPGLPCLYFGGSSFICWREIREPSKGEVHISRFAVTEGTELKVVNLAYRPALMAAMVNANLPEVNKEGQLSALAISYVTCWPLLAVCAIRRLHDGPFAPEYIVPQMLLQWISDTKAFHGIRFFSTRTEEFFDDPKTGVNYVFPARTTPANGYCDELRKIFKLTAPIGWNDATRQEAKLIALPRYKIRQNPIAELESTYGHVESVLDSLDLDFV
jgi:hypothetical protein